MELAHGSKIHGFPSWATTHGGISHVGNHDTRLAVTLLKKEAPMAISAEPPTIALLGKIPKGVKKACIDPPKPRLKPLARPKDFGQGTIKKESYGQVLLHYQPLFSTTRKQSPPRKVFHDFHQGSHHPSFRMEDIPSQNLTMGTVRTQGCDHHTKKKGLPDRGCFLPNGEVSGPLWSYSIPS